MSEFSEQSLPDAPGQNWERVQVGARMEKRMVKVLKGLAEYLDISLGDLIEGIVLHAFDNQLPFNAGTLQRIQQLKDVYGLDYDAHASHSMPAPEVSQTTKGEHA